jgi:hypothetical protein
MASSLQLVEAVAAAAERQRQSAAISEYERFRLDNIRRNEEMLRSAISSVSMVTSAASGHMAPTATTRHRRAAPRRGSRADDGTERRSARHLSKDAPDVEPELREGGRRRASTAGGGAAGDDDGGEAAAAPAKIHPGATNAGATLCEDCNDKQAAFGLQTDNIRRWCGSCAKLKGHANAVALAGSRMCEDCGFKHASFGSKVDRKVRWCGSCVKANGHDGAVNLNAKMCEDCNQKMASFGSQTDRKKRWCSGCVKSHNGHDGAEYLGKRYMCEDCGKKRSDWGVGKDQKRRWCGGCAKSHPGATNAGATLCEDCNDKQAAFGLQTDNIRRWCGSCAKLKGHANAVNLAGSRMCEDCGFKHASFGSKVDRKIRWCGSCVKANGHTDAMYLMAGGRWCEDCKDKVASWGIEGEKKRRWCGGCVKKSGHKDAVILGQKMCEDCGKKPATDRKKRWCGGCAKSNNHEGAVNVYLATETAATCESPIGTRALSIDRLAPQNQVWIRYHRDRCFYMAVVNEVSERGLTVTYPETTDWQEWTETIKTAEVTPERVRVTDPLAKNAATHRMSNAEKKQRAPVQQRPRQQQPREQPQPQQRLRLYFPTEEEAKRAQERGALLTEEDRAAAVAASEQQGPSEYVGVSWDKRDRRWVAGIRHGGKRQHLGSFDDEQEAARAVDTAARRLRSEDAHGGRASKTGRRWKLNFPTEEEAKRAQERGALLTADDKAAAAAAVSERQGPSEFVGVSWDRRSRKWKAQIRHDGKTQNLGSFDDEQEAARAADTAARRLRGEDAHGGRSGRNNKWNRLNFPTQAEVKRAQDRGALLTEEDKTAAVAASEQQGPSKFVGVSWDKGHRKWKAHIKHDGKTQNLGSFDDEQEAARAFDTAARRLRGEDAHDGGRANKTGRQWKLNFPTEVEVKRAQERGAAAPTIHGSDSRTQLRGVTEEGKAKRRDSSQGKRSSSKRQRTGLLLPPSRYANTVCFSHLGTPILICINEQFTKTGSGQT